LYICFGEKISEGRHSVVCWLFNGRCVAVGHGGV
jgi:hypothetical protein